MSLPLPVTPGRAGFAVDLRLVYDSGAGNGPFGLGWQLSAPTITRRTDKRLPMYSDADDFLMSGAEVVVPMPNGARDRGAFTVQRYRPRIEGAFARIERWTERATGDGHWRAITRDNVLHIYGRSAATRIADPARPDCVFSWLLEETRDDRGNLVRYEYRAEDGAGVDPTRACEASRFDAARAFTATAQRYLKRVQYGNRAPVLDREAAAPAPDVDWLFEIVFDYGEHDPVAPAPRDDADPQRPAWRVRADPFSSYRAGFEIRTYRLCRRVLMFHRFAELGATPALVRSLELGHDEGPIVSYLTRAREVGHVRDAGGAYTRADWPALELAYQRPVIGDELVAIDRASLEGIAAGVETSGAQWVDLDGEGLPGVLIPADGAWYYKAPLGEARFAPPAVQRSIPAPAELHAGQQLIDLGGDGRLDLVSYKPPLAGSFERSAARGWAPAVPFAQLPNLDWGDPELRFLDLDGDGLPDVIVAEHDAMRWYPSRGRAGFDPAERVAKPTDERRGPAVVFSGDRETIQFADMTGDGLVDLVRVRNGEVCYWPNLGFGRFGAKVILDGSPLLDAPDQFDPARVRFADVDGSGASDLIYLGRDGVRIHVNHAGNALAPAVRLRSLPGIDNAAALSVVDLLGRGTSCLVWSSPLASDPVRYVDLASGVRPHMMVRIANNLGAETAIDYASSTTFYLADERAGTPWITRLPFPVTVVARVETYDRVSQNRFVSRYAYHHGYFDGVEREFRGFGRVDQSDSEELSVLGVELGSNLGAGALPPVHTRTWFHTGAYLGRHRVSRLFAAEYYREPGADDARTAALLLPDTELPDGLTADEEREACRALKGTMLRREIYAADGSPRAAHPYTVTEQCYGVVCLQRGARDRHPVFLTHPRETLTYHYERDPADPRIGHEIALELDGFGNVVKAATIGYGRRQPDATLPLDGDRANQTVALATYVEHRVTNATDDDATYRAPLPCETRTFELIDYPATGPAGRYRAADLVAPDPADPARRVHIFDGELAYHAPLAGPRRRRLIEHVRTIYRRDDLIGPLALGTMGRRALVWDRFQLAFAPEMIGEVYQRPGAPPEVLIPDPAGILPQGGFRSSQVLVALNAFPAADADGAWWIPGGEVRYSPDPAHLAPDELAWAELHFFLPWRTRDAFGNEQIAIYDAHDLCVVEARDTVGNQTAARIDYRVLQPVEVRDANGSRTQIAFDARGMVAGTAAMGPVGQAVGDSLAGFVADLDEATLLAQLAALRANPAQVLGRATTRVIYDPFAYVRTQALPEPQPVVTCTLTREIHDADLPVGAAPPIRHALSYSDGFGREIQSKLPAEPGPLVDGGPAVERWVGSGWTIYNNKGLPVRQYEPFFTATHRFELARAIGVSAVMFYDPIGRVIATLAPDATYQKVVFDAWREVRWDANDTVLLDPRTDPDVAGHVAAYLATLPAGSTTWYAQRAAGALGPDEQAVATKTAAHAGTPSALHLDTLARPFLTLEHAGFNAGAPVLVASRVALDIASNVRSIRDSVVQAGDLRGREVARTLYDLAGRKIYEASLEAGTRWTLDDVAGQPHRSWDSRGQRFRIERDPLRRPVRLFVTGADPADPAHEQLVERAVYGEQHPDPQRNLRGVLFLHLDQAGAISDEQHDFRGNRERETRRLARDYRGLIDWSAVDAAIPGDPRAPLDLAALEAALAPALEAETFTSATRHDALGRAIQIEPPHDTAVRDVIQPVYNAANLVERIDVWFDRAAPAGMLDPVALPPAAIGVANIDYDAKGRRTAIAYKNGVTTAYRYDRLTFRLATATTSGGVQDLAYRYDAIGNITQIRDAAQDTLYFANRRVEPSTDYTYDPLYRLIAATGREHLGQGALIAHSSDDAQRVGLPLPGDGNALGTYRELYDYDPAGNLRAMRHVGAAAEWTRTFEHDEASPLEPGKRSNRLSRTRLGAGVETYSAGGAGYDPHGNQLAMPHLAAMQWGFRDQLRMTQRQVGANADRTWYVYDAAGVRVRKVTETAAGAVREQRLYFGIVERYRRALGGALVRDTLHVMDGVRRIASSEVRRQGNEPGVPARVTRYQLIDQVGSATVELDDAGALLSYEAYAPYGSTTLRLGIAAAPAKRYGFSGKERDDETGLVYFGARYHAPWLARWTSCDPAGYSDGPNRYVYVKSDPINHSDPDGAETLDRQIERIESPVGWFFARTGYDFWNALSFGTLAKVEGQNNLGTLEGLGDSTFTGARAFSNAASLGLQDRIYEAQMKEGPKGIITGTIQAGEDFLPIAEADVLANPDASAEDRWRAGALAVSKTANLVGLGVGLTGKNPVVVGKTAKVKLGFETIPGQRVGHNVVGVELEPPATLPENPAHAGQWFERVTTGPTKNVAKVPLRGPAKVTAAEPVPDLKVAEIEVPLSRAKAALSTAQDAVAAGPETFNVATNNCTTLGTGVLGAAGVPIPALSPLLTFWIAKYLPFAPLALQAAGTTNALVQSAKPKQP